MFEKLKNPKFMLLVGAISIAILLVSEGDELRTKYLNGNSAK